MWVQLLTKKFISVAGQQKNYEPGDWVNTGKTLARAWVADGSARVMNLDELDVFEEGTGIFVRGDEGTAKSALAAFGKSAEMATIGPWLQWPKTLVWVPGRDPMVEAFSAAWGLLDRWEVLAPLHDYNTMAGTMGTAADREALVGLVHDLRVPVYDTRMLFLRDCENSQRLIDAWQAYCQEFVDDRLAFLAALWHVKPLVLALPKTWYNRRAHGNEPWAK